MIDLVQQLAILQRNDGLGLDSPGQEPAGGRIAGRQRATHAADDPAAPPVYANDSPTGTSTRTVPE